MVRSQRDVAAGSDVHITPRSCGDVHITAPTPQISDWIDAVAFVPAAEGDYDYREADGHITRLHWSGTLRRWGMPGLMGAHSVLHVRQPQAGECWRGLQS